MGGCDLVVVIRLLGADIGQIHLGGDAFSQNETNSSFSGITITDLFGGDTDTYSLSRSQRDFLYHVEFSPIRRKIGFLKFLLTKNNRQTRFHERSWRTPIQRSASRFATFSCFL